MEFWVVAAATGAGYVAKHWQNLSGEKDACQVFDKMPHSVFPLPKLSKCLLDGGVSSPDGEINKVGLDLQDYTDGIDGKDECLYEFRTKKLDRKSFSSLRPLTISRDHQRTQMTYVDDGKDQKIVFMEEDRARMEAEFFEPAGSVKLPRRLEQMDVKGLETRDLLHSQGNEMVSLFLGVTIGILSTMVTNKREIEHLNELLEHAENLVRDLHDKLEMKEGFDDMNEQEDTESAIYSPKAKDFELTSDIEAELEAELDRLDANMQRLSSVVEIDSDFEADMARGDLNPDELTWQLETQSEPDPDDKRVRTESTGKPVFSPNYTVSALDLRLRLHEVIESELRARIEDLEAVLADQKGQTYPDSPEPAEENSFWDFDHTRIESSSSTP